MSDNGIKIKEQIDKNNKLIQDFLQPNQFTLNNSVAKLLEENQRLQAQCPHEFEDGYCIFCYAEEE